MPALLDTHHSADRQLIAVQALLAERRYARRARNRNAAAPAPAEDPGTYRCGCDEVFRETVSTHVACPRCGSDQPW